MLQSAYGIKALANSGRMQTALAIVTRGTVPDDHRGSSIKGLDPFSIDRAASS